MFQLCTLKDMFPFDAVRHAILRTRRGPVRSASVRFRVRFWPVPKLNGWVRSGLSGSVRFINYSFLILAPVCVCVCVCLCVKETLLLREPWPCYPMLSHSGNCSPAPDLVFFKPISPRVFFSGGVFVLQTPV